jgi:hypothetical protein
MIPSEEKASDVFRKLFMQGSQAEVEAQVRRLEVGQSILDTVGDQRKRSKEISKPRSGGSINTSKRARLEKRMQMSME